MTQPDKMMLAKLFTRAMFTGVMLFALYSTSLAQANTLEEAKQKLSQKDYAAAHAIYVSLANQNDAKACYNLGLMYQDGDGVAKNMD